MRHATRRHPSSAHSLRLRGTDAVRYLRPIRRHLSNTLYSLRPTSVTTFATPLVAFLPPSSLILKTHINLSLVPWSRRLAGMPSFLGAPSSRPPLVKLYDLGISLILGNFKRLGFPDWKGNANLSSVLWRSAQTTFAKSIQSIAESVPRHILCVCQ
jgi:hypothetical protein